MAKDWHAVWQESRFWEQHRPAEHFETPASMFPELLATFFAELARAERLGAVIDIGCGAGEILQSLSWKAPDLELTGVDVRADPGLLQDRWTTEPPGWQGGLPALLHGLTEPVLITAVEWLDELPCPITNPDRIRLGPKGPTGPLNPTDNAWLDTWWPFPESTRAPEAVAAVGRTRDAAWAWLAENAPPGSVLVAIDYGHEVTDRPADGGFWSYREGVRTVPPDPTANLTAAVAIDAVADAVERVGCERLNYHRLSELRSDISWETGSAARHRSPVEDLALRSQFELMVNPARFGSFWMIVHRIPE